MILNSNNIWSDFTSSLLEGEEEAQKHLESVIEFAKEKNLSPDRFRLREVSVKELKEILITEHSDLFKKYLTNLQLERLEEIIKEQTLTIETLDVPLPEKENENEHEQGRRFSKQY